MNKQTRTFCLAAVTITALAGLLFAGCASRNYPGPVHGQASDGTVLSIDLQNHRLILAPLKPGPPVAFDYDITTKFWKNGIPIHPNEVEPGQSVRVHYHASAGQLVAHHVYIQVPYAPAH